MIVINFYKDQILKKIINPFFGEYNSSEATSRLFASGLSDAGGLGYNYPLFIVGTLQFCGVYSFAILHAQIVHAGCHISGVDPGVICIESK